MADHDAAAQPPAGREQPPDDQALDDGFSLVTLVDAYEELLLHVLALEDEWRLDDRIAGNLRSGR